MNNVGEITPNYLRTLPDDSVNVIKNLDVGSMTVVNSILNIKFKSEDFSNPFLCSAILCLMALGSGSLYAIRANLDITFLWN